jgi:hypothetical protein
MKSLLPLALLMVAAFFLGGCARNYNITTNGGRVITSQGKPKYDREISAFVYKDARGEQRTIPAGSVRQIAPASDTTSTTGFNPQPAR